MKQVIATIIMLVLTVRSFAYDFSTVCETGQTLYFRILSEYNHEVTVTFPDYPQIGWGNYPQPVGDLVIPEFVEYENTSYTVVSIGAFAFDGCYEITSVELPNTIRRIETEAFLDCTGLSCSLVIPEQCTFIGSYAFMDCTALSSLIIGASVDTIQHSAFEDCISLQSIHCNTPTPPFSEHIPSNPYYEDRSIFNNVPTDIPVYVNCLTFDQFLLNWDWSRFVNLEGVFLGAPALTVGVNNPEYGMAEIISVPEDCDHQNATIRAIANPGHSFCYWKMGDAVISYEPEYSFPLVHACTITACFDTYAFVKTTAFPDHVIGRIINTSGQVINEFPSDFIYDEDGVLTNFSYPGHVISQYGFAHFPSRPSNIVSHYGGHPEITERYSFAYNNYDKIEHTYFSHWGIEDCETNYYYYYDNEMRLIKKEFFRKEYDKSDEYCFQRTFISYADGSRTQIDSVVYYYYEQVNNSVTTTTHYNQRMLPLTAKKETYNSAGELQSCILQTYSYTAQHKTDSIITQTLTNGEWVNSGVANYVYDDRDRVIEYQTGSWSADNNCWNITKKTIYDFNDHEQTLTVSFRKKNADEWVWDVFSNQTLLYESDLYEWKRALSQYGSSYSINQFEIGFHYETEEIEFPRMSEWYYELEGDDGSITYQHLEYTADTMINDEKVKIIVRTNQIYDKGQTEVTHEYLYEENNVVYWWNKDIEAFTILYDYAAKPGDEWEIKVGMESITVHVDEVGVFEYDGATYKRLCISDVGGVFNGDVVVGLGHLTSFFPEKLMNRNAKYIVDGLRCYWVEEALLYHNGNDDCDAIYSEVQEVNEVMADGFRLYPNPADGLITIEMRDAPSGQTPEYRITNVLGQTLMTGALSTDKESIDVSSLPAGMYFITFGKQSMKFVAR